MPHLTTQFFYRQDVNCQHLVIQIFNVNSLIKTADSRLFRSTTFSDHCLHNSLPSKCNHIMNLRPKTMYPHHIHTMLLKNSFVNRSIFYNCMILYFSCIFNVLRYCFFISLHIQMQLSLVFIKGYLT